MWLVYLQIFQLKQYLQKVCLSFYLFTQLREGRERGGERECGREREAERDRERERRER